MPHIPYINRRELKKSGILDEDRFFQLLSERCNYVDKNTVKTFYMALVKLTVSELREHGVIRFPHLGDCALVKQEPKSVLAGKSRIVMNGVYTLKFYFKDALKLYFKKYSNSFEEAPKIDPREKILNQII